MSTLSNHSTEPSLSGTDISNESSVSSKQRIFDIYPVSQRSCIQSDRDVKLLHFIRHAEGTHNVTESYRDICNLDARLTPKGEQQCVDQTKTSAAIQTIHKPQLVITSTMTRCIQTSLLSFPDLAAAAAANTNGNGRVPFVALESVRETVNFSCDKRRPVSELAAEFPNVDFSNVHTEHDEIWSSYDERLGQSYDQIKESAELHTVAERAREFFQWLESRTERELIVCTHSAFLRCLFGFGQDGGINFAPPQFLDCRKEGSSQNVPVIRFCGNEESFESAMRADYDNCELRSFLVAFPMKRM